MGCPFSILHLERGFFMWFLNKTTGLKWEVTDKELIKRLTKDEQYEKITAPKANNTASKTKSNDEK